MQAIELLRQMELLSDEFNYKFESYSDRMYLDNILITHHEINDSNIFDAMINSVQTHTRMSLDEKEIAIEKINTVKSEFK